MITQQDVDRAYDQGKAAFRRDFGSHGPTLKRGRIIAQANPYGSNSLLWQAWERGYAQDVRRIVVFEGRVICVSKGNTP